jgi:hypothetical protein
VPPAHLALALDSPNPFGAATSIRFDLPEARHVRLDIISMDGRCVTRLVDATLPPGRKVVTWDGKDALGRPVASGAYLCRLTAGGSSRTNRMVLMR